MNKTPVTKDDMQTHNEQAHDLQTPHFSCTCNTTLQYKYFISKDYPLWESYSGSCPHEKSYCVNLHPPNTFLGKEMWKAIRKSLIMGFTAKMMLLVGPAYAVFSIPSSLEYRKFKKNAIAPSPNLMEVENLSPSPTRYSCVHRPTP